MMGLELNRGTLLWRVIVAEFLGCRLERQCKLVIAVKSDMRQLYEMYKWLFHAAQRHDVKGEKAKRE